MFKKYIEFTRSVEFRNDSDPSQSRIFDDIFNIQRSIDVAVLIEGAQMTRY